MHASMMMFSVDVQSNSPAQSSSSYRSTVQGMTAHQQHTPSVGVDCRRQTVPGMVNVALWLWNLWQPPSESGAPPSESPWHPLAVMPEKTTCNVAGVGLSKKSQMLHASTQQHQRQP